VQPLGAGQLLRGSGAGVWYWLSRLDELAQDALYEDWTADRLEEELARMALPEVSPPPAPDLQAPASEGSLVEVPAERGADAVWHIGVEAQRSWAGGARGRAWWQARPDEGTPRLLLSRGLPAAATMARLFGPAATI
jgi:type VI secretion system protein ImpM